MTDQTPIPLITSILDFVAVDIETTGLDKTRDEIIEIAAVRFSGGEVVDRFISFVKPRKKIPRFIELLTNIKQEDLDNAPGIDLVLPKFFSFVKDSVVVGHNIRFDVDFIDEFNIRRGGLHMNNKLWDTADISRVYLPFTNDHKLSTITKHFRISLVDAHRANADATACGIALVELTKHITAHYSLILNAKILDLSKQAKNDNLYNYLYRVIEYQRRYALTSGKITPPENPLINVIEHDVPSVKQYDVKGMFGEGGQFAEKFPNYEYREGQLEMANHIISAFKGEHHLAVEAGTGVGKSFAYLVPAIDFTYQNKAKVVISTNTKNLQEQLFYKDIPNLSKIQPVPFKACLVKGRENYICERRWNELLAEQQHGFSPYEASALLYLIIWKHLTNTGDVSENSSFDRSRFSIVWRKVCSDRYLCSNRKCPSFKTCYVMTLRKHIETASIVVANHSLLLADIKAENTTMGEYSYLIIDEAHNLMASAARHLGFELNYSDIINLLNQLGSAHKRKHTGFLKQFESVVLKSMLTQGIKDQTSLLVKNIEEKIDALRKPVTDLFSHAEKVCQQADSYGKLRIKDKADFSDLFEHITGLAEDWKAIIKDIAALTNVLSSINSKQLMDYETLSETLSSFYMRMSETEEIIINLLNPDLAEYALWIETNIKPDKNIPSSSLCYAPIEVGGHLANLLYNRIPSIIFTSATLALRGSFKYFFGQSGLNLVTDKQVAEEIVQSPFDYHKQSKLLISSFLPEPKDMFFTNQALSCLDQIVSATRTGTMVLFTSYKDLNQVFDQLSDTLYYQKRSLFAQGKSGGRSSMLNEFKQSKDGVLLGTSSFWEGVDIQGESLSLLILYKLPFMVPSEPIVEAFIDKLEREDKDSFMHYMLPNALLRLRQGFGRLIRSKSDNGIVLIMDSRVTSKRYGEYFKQVLPCDSYEIRDEHQLISEISSFFNRRELQKDIQHKAEVK